MNDFITKAGGVNIATDITTGTITRENVLLKNPDAIVIVTMGIVGIEEKATWEKYTTLTATKNGKIFTVDPYKSCGPNPVTFVDVVEELITKLYK
jgi:ABC-type Fe3+-hydroxamate transport system, periplasmic component